MTAPFVIHVFYIFIYLFIHSYETLRETFIFLKTQVTKETEKLKARIEIEESKSNSSRYVTVSNEYFHFFSIVFPSFEKGKKVLLICIRVKNVHLKDFFRHKHHFSFSKGSTPQEDSENRGIAQHYT